MARIEGRCRRYAGDAVSGHLPVIDLHRSSTRAIARSRVEASSQGRGALGEVATGASSSCHFDEADARAARCTKLVSDIETIAHAPVRTHHRKRRGPMAIGRKRYQRRFESNAPKSITGTLVRGDPRRTPCASRLRLEAFSADSALKKVMSWPAVPPGLGHFPAESRARRLTGEIARRGQRWGRMRVEGFRRQASTRTALSSSRG